MWAIRGQFDAMVRRCLRELQAVYPHIRYRVALPICRESPPATRIFPTPFCWKQLPIPDSRAKPLCSMGILDTFSVKPKKITGNLQK